MNKKSVIFISLFVLVALGFTLAPQQQAPAQPGPVIAPTEVPVEYRWDLESIYPDATAWEKDYAKAQDIYLPRYKDYEGRLGDDARLLELFKMDDEASRLVEKLYVYAYMKRDEDQESSAYSEMSSKAESLYTDFSTAASFVQPELIALPEATLQAYIQDARFLAYSHFFDTLLKRKAHTLGKEEEKLLAMTGEMANAPDTIATKIREADIRFPTIKDKSGKEIQLDESQYYALLTNPDRDLRKAAFEGVLGAYNNSRNSLAAALDSQVRKDIFFAQARKYNSALESAVGENYIPVEVFDNLITTTNKNLPALQKYITLRKKVLKLDKVRTYDILVSVVEDYQKAIPYPESQRILNAALEPLGSDYLDVVNAGFKSRWIDVYPAEKKTSGAYSWGSYDTHPFILANYNDTPDGVLEIAHEMGHALNSYYTNLSQPYMYSDTPIFTAEVASTTNEILTLKYLLKNAGDDSEKLYYLDKMAENVRGTFFLQVMYAEFEKQIHERVEKGDALSVESLNKMWGDLLVKYYGPDFEVDELAKVGWSRIPHFYYNFYVYQYATGLAASNQFITDMEADKPGAIKNYLQFLSAGSSNYPVNVLKTAGVDMASPTPVDNLLTEFSRILDQMEVILVKQGKIQ